MIPVNERTFQTKSGIGPEFYAVNWKDFVLYWDPLSLADLVQFMVVPRSEALGYPVVEAERTHPLSSQRAIAVKTEPSGIEVELY